MKNLFFTKIFLVTAVSIFLFGCGASFENFSAMSGTIHVVETADPFFILSENFASALASLDFTFGSFTVQVDFLGRIATDDESARVEILRADQNILTVFEWRPTLISRDDALQKVRENLSEFDLQSAIFGAESFYFLQNNLTTNIVPFEKSVLAFRFDSKNFSAVRDLIASFLLTN
jgi:hypothetical protein